MAKKGTSGGEIVKTVEESNALRKSLGLKPLAEGKPEANVGSSKNPVDAVAERASKSGPSEADIKKQKAAAKNKREHEELTSGKGIADILVQEEGKGNASDWISRTREKDGSMKGASDMAAQDAARKKKAAGSKDDAKVPTGMKVRHDESSIVDGTEVTMVLSDQQLLTKDGELADPEDELSNVRMTDAERAKHNDAQRKQVAYDPDKEGQDILEKYNELKTGPKGFMIGGTSMGAIEETDPEKRLAILTALSEKHSLDGGLRFQADYYTSAEMKQKDEQLNKFRKPPKKKTKRKRDEKKEDKDDQIGGTAPLGTAKAGRPADAGSDEEDPELYEQLSKQRRLVRRSDAGAVKKGEAALQAVGERITAVDADEDKEAKEKAILGIPKNKDPAETIAMTATTEFCNVVQTPLEKMDTMKHESFRGSTLYKQQTAQRKGIKTTTKGSKHHHAHVEDLSQVQDKDDDENILAEGGLDMSCASGLAYLRARAQIGNDQESHKNRKTDNRPLEMSTLDGDIKLEYRDDYGRVQTPKEAFRAISWKFHGKVPGRKNMERRLLRLEHEMRLKSMDPFAQLPTLRALRHVQSNDAKPYMVLSGANEK
jgi:U4/U6.U5 tri-snRNP-associated protein 1